MQDKFVGALLGTAVGDALGMPLEGLSHEEIEGEFGYVTNMIDGRLPKGYYTDDTQLMIGLAESLIHCRGFSGNHMVNRFMDNFEAFRGYGTGTVRVLQQILDGQPWEKAAMHIFGGGSYGNGAAMRIAPVGVLYNSKPEELIKVAESTCRITHTHPLGIEGGILQAYTVNLAAGIRSSESNKLDPIRFLEMVVDLVEHDDYKSRFKQIEIFLTQNDEPPLEEVINTLGVGIQAHKSVPMALYCFLKKNHSFSEAVTYAVNMGGDTDTIGAMTGAIAGAFHGAESIPAEWLNTLENTGKGRDHIRGLGEKLFGIYQNK